ncbi:MAG TPA: hypothetical protein V6C58_12050 [Allocoleopsis sp.]
MQNNEFNQLLEQVCKQVSSLSKGDRLAIALRQNQDYIPLVDHQELGDITAICAVKGVAPQNLLGEPISTNFDDYLQQVINPQICTGEITDGSKSGDYDDRKLRWSGSGITGNWYKENQVLSLEVGPTTYPRYAMDLQRSKIEALQLMLKGLENYHDPYIFFSKAIAVTLVPISKAGYVYIGERSATVDNPGLLNFVAGLATFHDQPENVNFYADVQQELQEEMGINLKLNGDNTRLIGIAGNPFTSENDLVFITQTQIDDSHFENFNLVEHLRLVPIKNKFEANQLLKQGILPTENSKKLISYGSRMALEYLIKHHF